MKKRLAQWFLRALGWKLEGAKPLHSQYVLIAAPHTSNWDFPLMIAFAMAFDIKINWMGKDSLFKPPMGTVMKALGGIPIIRSESRNVVGSMVDAFTTVPHLVLVVPAEGTRNCTKYWKSGFYQIAKQANVPIVPSFLDWGRRTGGFGPALELSGSVTQDMQYFRDFYAGMRGKFSDNFGPVRLREEDEEHE